MRIAVLGPGGVGGLIAGLLSRSGEQVTVIARPTTAETIGAHGIAIDSVMFGRFTVHPKAAARLDHDADVLIVASKAVGLAEALDRIAILPRLVVPLLNGLDHLAVLRRSFPPDSVAAASIVVEADRPEPGVVVHSSPFLQINLASENEAGRAQIDRLAAVLATAGVTTRILNSESQLMWSKLVFLNALACTTTAHEKTIGEIRTSSTLRTDLVAAIAEAAAVARAEGAEVHVQTTIQQFDSMHATLGSSMQRDIEAGRVPELDAIPGAVLRAAETNHLRCPTIERLVATIAVRAGLRPPTPGGSR